ncbi:tRNA (guanine(26)-N(2)/guanine(27)-N(2))-dimethyltransferase [Acaryochloris thomasi RCC1774]|uniref:tRNA (Guanine(26)-N(2)/guanine(27)-N(2))-dimethyltransferase n=1 Tax=Acaryochloris thomasi RCC1774 TaxID=1764569 RepID=A0A2W1JMN0_9CYAN|nr:tRNA (guanine-N1)-methyltransferase [Acaryochloris thomasi]PZD74610.1 tRNA (guanine(26)-N(2)/guanine(27)-N(2))-dimethyltransferase [Acaryochloris thomasi RCC1774]
MNRRQEGQVTFEVRNAFYRSTSQTARDLGVLAAAVYRQNHPSLRVLDAMAGCGVRSLRYAVESKADWVWANDANPEVAPVLSLNLAQLNGCFQLTHWPAKRLFADCYQRQDFYDLVDIDSFGRASPFLGACLQATKLGGFIYLTGTDSRTVAGHDPDACLGHYGTYGRSHPAAHEQGLRILIGSLQQQAIMQGLVIEPVFSLFQGQIYRVMVRLAKAQISFADLYGFLGYCHQCGHYQTVGWRYLSQATCPDCSLPLTLSGPMWLGPLHDPPFLAWMTELAQVWHWPQRVDLLELMQAEAGLPPYFYTVGELGKRGQMDIPKRDRIIQALKQAGYRASKTHINPQAIKTTATFKECLQIARRQ